MPVTAPTLDGAREVDVVDPDEPPWDVGFDELSRVGDEEPGTGPSAGGRGRVATVGMLIEGVVTLGVVTRGVVIGPAVTAGTVAVVRETVGTETVGTETVGTETVGTESVGVAAEASDTPMPADSAPHTARTVRRQRLTD